MSPTQARLQLSAREVGPWPMNTYVLVCPATRQSVLIDPGADPEVLMKMLADTVPSAILVTHTHPDHIGALEEMRRRLGVPVMAHPGPHFQDMSLDVDRLLNDGDLVRVGHHAIRVYHTPGHIDDLVCFALWDTQGQGDQRVIVGDTLFAGGPGKTWSNEGFQETLTTLKAIVLRWPDEAQCYPGHGDSFRLGDIRADVEVFLATDHGDFYGDATWDM